MSFGPIKEPNKQTPGKAIATVGKNIWDRTIGRLLGAGLRRGAEGLIGQGVSARWSARTGQSDWRVKLTLPIGSPLRSVFFGDPSRMAHGDTYDVEKTSLLGPLEGRGGIVFPLTPVVMIQQMANYNPMEMTHSNYPHFAYRNSQVDSLNIIGEFAVQNQQDAMDWVATVHFLRAVSKMFFGSGAHKGNPPPILHLNGYGQHVFKNVPVVIQSFNVELQAGVDYISTSQDPVYFKHGANYGNPTMDTGSLPETWAPSLSNITVGCQPVYSREAVKAFSMEKFARGELSGDTESIGYI